MTSTWTHIILLKNKNSLRKSLFQAYLAKYNYFPQSRYPSGSAENFMDAIKTFQRFFKLEVTGELNNETIAVMKKPRCGNPAFGHLGRRQKRYKTHYRGWQTRNLRYYIEAGEDIDEAT